MESIRDSLAEELVKMTAQVRVRAVFILRISLELLSISIHIFMFRKHGV